ncbi:putative transmembrane protein [Brevibacterium aurantiacum]|uniref:Putative transmembrane protein n=1 Tax=Brevibacterium aurantiacum TaxID=273384 RepID=A0A1D7W460_BREAU|nr:putative transmembrane protein [Brevibacterium aurantiacum]
MDALIVGATVVSLVAVVFGLLRSQQADVVGTLSAILALVSVVVSWALINTVYAFKLARMYYHDEQREFAFDQQEEPTYSDFAFVSFTVGMAYTFGDAKLTSTEMRRVAFGYSLLAYAFGTFVIAVALNLVTSLGQSG